MSRDVTVIVGAAGAPWEHVLLQQLGRRELGVHVRRRCSEVGELIGVTRRDRPDAVLVDGTLPWLDREVLLALRRTGARVVAVGGDPGVHSGLVQVVPADADVEEVVAALVAPAGVPAHEVPVAGAAAEDVKRAARAWGRTVAVWSGPGAPGRTTVAIHLAVDAARAGRQVLLVDGDTWGASIAQLLGLDESPSLAQAAHAAEADWPCPLDDFLQRGPAGTTVLAGLPHPDLWAEVTASAWEAVLTAAAQFDLVVVDVAAAGEEDEELVVDRMPIRRNVMTTVTLDRADDIVLVAAADPVGLRRSVVAHRRLQDRRDPRADTVRVVLNRAPRPGRRLQDCSHAVGEWTGVPPVALLPDEPLLARSVWEGRPLHEIAPRSRWLRELRALVLELGGAAA